MAIRTALDRSEIEPFLEAYRLGGLKGFEPIAQGIENSNYLVHTGAGPLGARFVLTLFETATPEEVTEILALSGQLSDRGVPCPLPLAGPTGWLGTLRGKPAILVPFVEGIVVWEPSGAHLEAFGKAVGLLHLAGADLALSRPGAHQARTLCPLAEALAERLSSTDAATAELLRAEAEYQRGVPESALPGGLIHADLFRDNVLFDSGAPLVKALLDFHLAGQGPWVFDVGVALCDAGWTGFQVSGERARAFLAGYRSVRPLGRDEFEALPAYLRRVALRFLCLRLERCFDGSRMVVGSPKDPAEFAAKLRLLRHAS